MPSISEYNYLNFHASDYDFSKFAGLNVGQRVPETSLKQLDGTVVRLGDLLGERPLVLETGSITCPMYAKCVAPMQRFVERYPGLNFKVLYVREAHPGERVGGHQSMEQKLQHARDTVNAYREGREILLDEVTGDLHQALGGLPNMIYVIGSDGTILFRSTWNNTREVEAVFDALSTGRAISPRDFKPIAPTPFKAMRTLLFGGLRAVFDFVVELPRLLWMHAKEGNL